MKKAGSILMVAAACVLLAGCVSETSEQPSYTRCSTSKSHDGVVTISWESRVGTTYCLVAYEHGRAYHDDRIYRGTGETITVKFKRNPEKPLPEYRVLQVDETSR